MNPPFYMTLPLQWGVASDAGQERANNEDAYAIEPESGLFLVSDGMGGHRGGELASEIVTQDLPPAIEIALVDLTQKTPRTIRRILTKWIAAQSHQVLQESRSESGFKDMGATLVLALFVKNRAYIAAFRRAVKPTQTTTTTTTTGVAEMKCPVPAGAGSPSGRIGGLPYWQGHFFVGLNYGKAYAKTREECHRACAADKNCTSWTWIARQKKCVFKHYCPKKTFTQGPMEVSGYSGRSAICGEMRPGCGLEAATPAARTAPVRPAPTQPAPAPAPQQPSGWQVIN